MIFNLYSIKDKKSDFGAPVPIKDDAQAIRWFDNQVKTTPFMNEYAEDFELYQLGTFDAESSQISGTDFPRFIISAEEVKGSERKVTIPDSNQ